MDFILISCYFLFHFFKTTCFSFFFELLDYAGELFQFYMTLTKQQLQDACNDLKEMVPEPMNTMLEKQPKEEAIRKWADRMNLVTRDVPPTAPPGTYVHF